MTPATNCDGRLLGVFAKEPLAGRVKTRLAQSTCLEWAQRVAQAFLEDSLDRFQHVRAARRLVYAPASATAFFTQLAHGRYECIPQSEGNLGRRLHDFFTTARGQGFSRIVAVGADSPTLPLEYIEQAFVLLEINDVVIGPASDGGYYLIGCGIKEFGLFEEIPWSTPGVLEATVNRLRGAQARLALLPPWYDVDSADDWAMLRGHVRAMRQAGLDPGVPCVDRLIEEQN